MNPSSGKDKFEIYTSSGEIELIEPLDYENETSFVITIVAQVRWKNDISTALLCYEFTIGFGNRAFVNL